MSGKKQPEYVLVIAERDSKNRTIAGAAFRSKFGGLSIVLGPGVYIDSRVAATCWLTLVPYEDASGHRRQAVADLKDPEVDEKPAGEVPIS